MSEDGTQDYPLTPHQAARRLGVSVGQVWRWLRSGELLRFESLETGRTVLSAMQVEAFRSWREQEQERD